MEHPGFFERAGPFSLAEVAKATGAELAPGAAAAETMIEDVRKAVTVPSTSPEGAAPSPAPSALAEEGTTA